MPRIRMTKDYGGYFAGQELDVSESRAERWSGPEMDIAELVATKRAEPKPEPKSVKKSGD